MAETAVQRDRAGGVAGLLRATADPGTIADPGVKLVPAVIARTPAQTGLVFSTAECASAARRPDHERRMRYLGTKGRAREAVNRCSGACRRYWLHLSGATTCRRVTIRTCRQSAG